MMKGLGTIVNFAAVIVGSGIGMLVRGRMSSRFKDIMVQACGIAVIFIGIGGVLQRMLVVSIYGLTTQGTVLLVVSLALGGIFGEIINIEKHMDTLGEKLKSAVKAKNDNSFVEGFVSATLVICVGAMAIVGSLQDGLTGDHAMLFTKALLDFIIVMVMASSMGASVMFSALPILVYQGLITLLAVFIAPLFSSALISDLSLVGSALIFGVGINLTFGKRIRVGNLLPALFVPVIWEAIQYFVK